VGITALSWDYILAWMCPSYFRSLSEKQSVVAMDDLWHKAALRLGARDSGCWECRPPTPLGTIHKNDTLASDALFSRGRISNFNGSFGLIPTSMRLSSLDVSSSSQLSLLSSHWAADLQAGPASQCSPFLHAFGSLSLHIFLILRLFLLRFGVWIFS